MLRRRIFSSAMASVMALSSVAVVANAEDTQMKTKADLEKLVNETYGDDFRIDDLSEYGSVSADAVLDALEAADAILADDEADDEDYTVAYKMVEAAVARLVIYTAEELQELINSCKSIVDSNNIYNEELQDLIYDPADYENLCKEYANAEMYVSADASAEITEAYEKLAKAKDDLTKMDIVSKSMFRSALKEYEAVRAAEFKFEDWRRGQVDGWPVTSTGGFWVLTGGTKTTSFGTMWSAAMACNNKIKAAYDSIDAIKTLSKTSDVDIVEGYKMAKDAVALFNCWTADESSRATKAGVNMLLEKYHNVLVADYATTAAQDLYDAIVGKLDLTKSATTINKSYGSADTFTGGTVSKLMGAEWKVVPSVNLYVPVDVDGYCVDVAKIDVTGKRPDDNALPAGAKKWQLVSAKSGYDILKFVKVTAEDVTADGDINPADNGAMDAGAEWPVVNNWALDGVIKGEVTSLQNPWGPVGSSIVADALANNNDAVINLSKAYALAMDYLDGDDNYYTMDDSIDTTGVVADGVADGISKEWAIVYRYLKYALQDKYDASTSSEAYTKAQVKALIEDCYDLADLTGDAAIFNDSHEALVNARQAAIEWAKLADSDKMYKEYTGRVGADGDPYVSSTVAYIALKNAYNTLMDDYNAMKYSFGDIYEKIAEVSEMIDDGDLEATEALLKALDDTAYALSTIADEHDDGYEDNAAFDLDRVFQPHNRLITNTGDARTIGTATGITTKDGANPTHAALNTAYTALLAAVDAQLAPATKLGDVDGNGSVNALDAAEILKSVVGLATVDAKVADFNADGIVNALDASDILKAVVNGTV